MIKQFTLGLWAVLGTASLLVQNAAAEDIYLWDDDNAAELADSTSAWQTTGFIEAGIGSFTRNNALDKTASLMELRGQFGANRYLGPHFVNLKIEGLADDLDDDQWQIKVRELYADLKLSDNLNIRAGQQVLTWGTGDYLFLNDFFAKDWQSMLSGREDSYLKASQAAIRLNWYTPLANVNAVWTPVFAEDEIISGERFVYFNPMAGGVVSEPRINARKPDKKLNNGQFALRLAKTIDGVEYALYGYHGFHTQPQGFDPIAGLNIYPRLNSFGSSIRRPLWGGIANAEVAYWNYLDEHDGTNPLVPNDQWNMLLGYEREIATNLTLGGQWMIQKMQNYDNTYAATPNPAHLPDEWHHTLTTRLTWTAMQQKLNLSLFAFYSPDSEDFYLKPKMSYRQNDHWQYELGANIFGGKHQHTQWGQFKDNSNIYARARYNF
ncbi:hypothetical protein L0B52_05875 [Suttonella sp. R2A3]|uniref:DUF1302 family protein n=1 Tax=Suttonella sp. R2A3 TaxID=2908648 RepID=UPI001F1E3ABD|nr:DUF1302 family protein [Suttonella sp. R2A3]UJF23875.1 hypothetical protein L0B52_05875 [Suttonella sp. R2A3]